jgi:hypothetical protein
MLAKQAGNLFSPPISVKYSVTLKLLTQNICFGHLG